MHTNMLRKLKTFHEPQVGAKYELSTDKWCHLFNDSICSPLNWNFPVWKCAMTFMIAAV